MLIVDEAKAVDDLVFQSLDKCTWIFKLVVSSAGPATGRFFQLFTSQSDYWARHKVTFDLCPHMNQQQRLADLEIYGEASTFYRNRWMGEFASDGGTSVISLDAIRDCAAHPPQWVYQNHVTAGLDFAAGGGDYCCLSLASGNKIELKPDWYWRHANPNHSAAKFVSLFKELGLKSHQISGDCGGLGIGFIYNMQEAGFYIREIHNGSPAKRDDLFVNLAAEWWDAMNVLITKRAIILPQNEKLFQQLSDRRKEYSIHNGQVKTKLESKLDMRARGADSPDLADSVIMACMTGWGGWPSSLNPVGNKLMSEEFAICAREMERNRSMFATEFVDFSGGF
jgi:hypothetical protein